MVYVSISDSLELHLLTWRHFLPQHNRILCRILTKAFCSALPLLHHSACSAKTAFFLSLNNDVNSSIGKMHGNRSDKQAVWNYPRPFTLLLLAQKWTCSLLPHCMLPGVIKCSPPPVSGKQGATTISVYSTLTVCMFSLQMHVLKARAMEVGLGGALQSGSGLAPEHSWHGCLQAWLGRTRRSAAKALPSQCKLTG